MKNVNNPIHTGNHPKPQRQLSARDKILYSLAAGCILSANVAVYIGLLLPPKGEIHSSLLTFFGLVCAFAGTLFGISADFRSTLMSFRTDAHTDTEKNSDK